MSLRSSLFFLLKSLELFSSCTIWHIHAACLTFFVKEKRILYVWQLISFNWHSFGLIFGQSGSGKTTLLQVLHFLSLNSVNFFFFFWMTNVSCCYLLVGRGKPMTLFTLQPLWTTLVDLVSWTFMLLFYWDNYHCSSLKGLPSLHLASCRNKQTNILIYLQPKIWGWWKSLSISRALGAGKGWYCLPVSREVQI